MYKLRVLVAHNSKKKKEKLYQDFTPIIIFVVLTVALIAAPLIIQYVITPRHNKGGDKLVSFECGELPEHNAWVKFNIRFYIIALVFLIFDVEVIFLYPWAVVFQELGLLAFIEMFIFILILIAGFAYVWVKGDLDWVKMSLKYGSGRYGDLKNTGENR